MPKKKRQEGPKDAADRLQRTLALAVEKARGVTALEVLGALEVVKARVLIESFGLIMDSDLIDLGDEDEDDDNSDEEEKV